MQNEEWFDRAVEDELQAVIDRIRNSGKDVHNVGSLRKKVDADLNARRGTPAWTLLRNRYDPLPSNEVRWCCVCDRPLSNRVVTAWLEDNRGNTYCGKECQEDTRNHPITWSEFKSRVRDAGSHTCRRREIVDGVVVEGEEITVTYDEIKHIGAPLSDLMIDWDSA